MSTGSIPVIQLPANASNGKKQMFVVVLLERCSVTAEH